MNDNADIEAFFKKRPLAAFEYIIEIVAPPRFVHSQPCCSDGQCGCPCHTSDRFWKLATIVRKALNESVEGIEPCPDRGDTKVTTGDN